MNIPSDMKDELGIRDRRFGLLFWIVVVAIIITIICL
jgi:hypothetical protein